MFRSFPPRQERADGAVKAGSAEITEDGTENSQAAAGQIPGGSRAPIVPTERRRKYEQEQRYDDVDDAGGSHRR